MDKNYEIRLNNVKLMHNSMIDMNNENAYMAWIWEMPDCPIEEDFEWFDPSTNTMRPRSGEYEILYGGTSIAGGLKKVKVMCEF